METYIIAEAGQNHNGNMKTAKQLIDMAAMPIIDKAFNRELTPVNAIKFTKRDLSEELTKMAWNKPYNSPNAFASTYGEHRKMLELTYNDHIELGRYANEKGLDFIETLTSPKAVKLTEKMQLKYIKVASRDLTHIPLLDEIGRTKIPVVLSTGMGGEKEINNALEVLTKYHDDIVILHCLSQYPADYRELNLMSIPYLKEKYSYKIGYSDHSVGIVAPVVAVALGAEFIEKHVTLNHAMKGSDHRGALEPDGLWRMTRDIRNMEVSLGKKNKELNHNVLAFKEKLERSLCTKNMIKNGEMITEKDLVLLSPGGGLSWFDKDKVIGKRANKDIDEMSQLHLEDF